MGRKEGILFIRQALIERRDSLRRALSGDLSVLRGLRSRVSGDAVEAAMGLVHDETAAQLAEVESQELIRVEYALEQISAGTFGVCEDCGANIPMERLNAIFYATRCIKCQRTAERQNFAPADQEQVAQFA
jgi:DnaK suppressor protein